MAELAIRPCRQEQCLPVLSEILTFTLLFSSWMKDFYCEQRGNRRGITEPFAGSIPNRFFRNYRSVNVRTS